MYKRQALSESQQQDVALEVDKQFQSHLSKISITVDEDDVSVLRNDWVKGHILDIIQASHGLKEFHTRVPFCSEVVATEDCKCMSKYLADAFECAGRQRSWDDASQLPAIPCGVRAH